MIFIAHNLAVVQHISDTVAVMKSGKIVELGSSNSVFNSPKNSYTKSLISAIPKFG